MNYDLFYGFTRYYELVFSTVVHVEFTSRGQYVARHFCGTKIPASHHIQTKSGTIEVALNEYVESFERLCSPLHQLGECLYSS